MAERVEVDEVLELEDAGDRAHAVAAEQEHGRECPRGNRVEDGVNPELTGTELPPRTTMAA
jgi:hypothetical protein